MIKPIQLLKESFATYKANIKNIIFMTWPIALLTIAAGYYSSKMEGMGDYKPMVLSILIAGIIVNIISSVLISLFFKPALFRSIQKNEDNKNFDVKEGYLFQKKNIWNYIVLFFWNSIYFIKVNWKYLIILVISLFLGASIPMFVNNPMTSIVSISMLLIISVVFLVLMIIRNFAKFIYSPNVFFSTDLKPRDAVKKAIEIGTKNNGQVWLNILSYILLSIILMIVYFIIGAISSFLPGDMTKDLVAIILSSLIVSFAGTPLMFIIYAKGYNVLKEEKVEELVITE